MIAGKDGARVRLTPCCVVAAMWCVAGRFIAEVPQAHAQRLQAILPFLLKGHNGQALPFLLPGLLQCSEQNPDPELQPSPQAFQQWLTVLQQPEVRPCLYRSLMLPKRVSHSVLHDSVHCSQPGLQSSTDPDDHWLVLL